MISDTGQDKFETFSILTESLQNYMRANKVEKALQVAQERHRVLVSLLESVGLMGFERFEYAMKAMACIDKEQRLAKDNASESRNDFVSRRNAFKAYGISNK
jgi:translation initiation factor 2 alpha subunit (eIF-2alpha)